MSYIRFRSCKLEQLASYHNDDQNDDERTAAKAGTIYIRMPFIYIRMTFIYIRIAFIYMLLL
jgi:hypothetical protein